MEPEYIRQTAQPEHIADLSGWFTACQIEAEAEGITFARLSVDDHKNPTMAIVEGWKKRPDEQGEIRWALTGVKS
jgi:hypothetical protein